MLKHPGNFIGDSWFYTEGDIVHAYYLTSVDSIPPHTKWDVGHATSRDLVNWEIQPLALLRGADGEWDECIATGSIFRDGARYGMAFTAHTRAETGIAWSDDLYHWTKDTNNPTTVVDESIYEGTGTGVRPIRHWRDPFIIQHDGLWYQLVCASAKDEGVVGVATSPDLKQWTVIPPLQTERFSEELECPQIYHRDGRWYLLFSSCADWLYPAWRERLGARASNGGYTMIAADFEGPYRVAEQPRIFAPEVKPEPYAVQILSFRGQDYAIGTLWEEKASYLSDPVPVKFTAQGIVGQS